MSGETHLRAGELMIDGKTLLDLTYPVGSLYWSNNSTNPSTLFGGTWKAITDTMIMARGTKFTTNGGNPEGTVTISTSNMPSHTHGFTPSGTVGSHTHTMEHTHDFSGSTVSSGGHTHSRGTMEITGSWDVVGGAHAKWYGSDLANMGAITHRRTGRTHGYKDFNGNCDISGFDFTASRSWSGETSSNGSHSHSYSGTSGRASTSSTGSAQPSFTGTAGATSSTGNGTALNIMPPYQVKYCWERIS